MTYRDYNSEGRRGETPYRSRDGMVAGVCKGLAQHMGWSVFWMRFAVIGLALLTAGWIVPILYVVAAFLMKPEPVLPLETDEDEEFYNSYTSSRTMALRRLKKTYDSLNRRLQRMEDIVTARDYDWDRRLHEDR